MGYAEYGGERREPRASPGGQVRPRPARLGSEPPAAPADAGPRRRTADGAGAAPRAQSTGELRLRRCRYQPQGLVSLRLDVALRGREQEWWLADPQGDRDSCRACC